jgi:hypothetical protein
MTNLVLVKPATLKMTTYGMRTSSAKPRALSSTGNAQAGEKNGFHSLSAEKPPMITEERRESMATTETTPLSPSTKGTSIGTQDSNDTGVTRKLAAESSHVTPSTPSTGKMSEEQMEEDKGASATVRSLKKKSSR